MKLLLITTCIFLFLYGLFVYLFFVGCSKLNQYEDIETEIIKKDSL